jgi:hypothetical protein
VCSLAFRLLVFRIKRIKQYKGGTSFTDVGLMPLPLFVFTHSNTARDTRNDWVVQTMRMMEAVERLIEDLILRRTQDGPHPVHVNDSHIFVCGKWHAV